MNWANWYTGTMCRYMKINYCSSHNMYRSRRGSKPSRSYMQYLPTHPHPKPLLLTLFIQTQPTKLLALRMSVFDVNQCPSGRHSSCSARCRPFAPDFPQFSPRQALAAVNFCSPTFAAPALAASWWCWSVFQNNRNITTSTHQGPSPEVRPQNDPASVQNGCSYLHR